MRTFGRVTLPNGVSVHAPSAFEAAVVYREVFVERAYEQHGITIRDDSVIFDIGANIGLFSIRAAQLAPRARVHAFEPVTALFTALQQNLATNAPAVRAWNVGLADAPGEAIFEIDRFSTITSTMHPDVFETRRGAAPLMEWFDAGLADMDRVMPDQSWLRTARASLHRPITAVPAAALLACLAAMMRVRRRLFLRHQRCRLMTLSAALAVSGAASVDLVKIDVEGAEEQVLLGIAPQDWDRLGQFVIEVHDVDGRLARMTRLLENRGYRVAHDREDWAVHALLAISTLYATRA